MSRVTVSRSTWPFGPAAAEADQEFRTVREVRTMAAVSVAMAAVVVAVVLVGTLLALVLGLFGLGAIVAAATVFTYRTIERPSPAVSRARSLRFTRVFWAARIVAAAAFVAALVLRA